MFKNYCLKNEFRKDLIVSHAMPLRTKIGDAVGGAAMEQLLHEEMAKLNLSLVGW